MDESDLRQEAITRCLMAGYLVNPEKPYSGPYFRKALQSVLRDQLRRNASQGRRESAFLFRPTARERFCSDTRHRAWGAECEDPAKRAEVREELELLNTAMNRVPLADRELIQATDLQGESCESYARSRGETKDSVRSRRWRAHNELRRVSRMFVARGA